MVGTLNKGRVVLAGITALALILSLLMVLGVPSASAEDQDNNNYPSVYCGTGDTRETAWHWVHNQIDTEGITAAELTAMFEVLTGPNTGDKITLTVAGDIGNNIHYDLYYPYGLKLLPTPSDDVTGGKLLLSHYPVCEETTTTVGETTTTAPSTSTSSVPETTTTTVQQTTLTTAASTTTTTERETTTTTEQETTTTELETTTTAGETTTTAGETTTTAGETTTSGPDVEETTVTTAATTTTEESTTSIPTDVKDSEVTTTVAPDDEVEDLEVLPFTGMDTELLFGVSIALLATGLVMIQSVRRRDEQDV